MKVSKRQENLAPYLFIEINKRIAEKKAKGEEVVSFGIGDPDMPTPPHIIEKLCQAARDPANHRYPDDDGLLVCRQAVADWYKRRFGVSLDVDKEVLLLIGAKEGIAHFPMCILNPGDIALVTDPHYPVYPTSVMLAGGRTYYLPLKEETNFLPDVESVPAYILKDTRLMWLNYPNNPTGATADLDFFNKMVKFAREHDIVLCHDTPYTEVSYDGYQPPSILQAEGAKDVAIEFHSLSKTYNMTGWRIGMAVGGAHLVQPLKILKSNLDSGIPQAIQYMAAEALNGPQDAVQHHNAIYQRRRDLVVDMVNKIGLKASLPKAGLYIWAKVPEGYTSMELAQDLLDKVGVVVTPGTGYGQGGEGYVRLSLTIPDATLVKGLSRLAEWRNTRQMRARAMGQVDITLPRPQH